MKYFKIYNAVIALLLAFLGFTVSCGKLEYGTPSVPYTEYGTPNAKFIVKGEVESSQTDQPIKNILVIMQRDSVLTDSTGHYQVDSYGFPVLRTFSIKFHDIDGNLNGEYFDLDTTVVFTDPQFINGDGQWYAGETSKEFNVQLKPKK